jgi:hypothetical protein
MAAGKELFKLFGLIGMQGVEVVEKDLKKIDKQSRKLQKEIGRLGRKVSDVGKVLTKAFTAPLLAMAAGVGVLAVKTGEYADKLLDLEQITGLTTTKLQEYEHVAREAGVSFEGFVGIISKFQGRMPQLIDGQGRAAETMDELGVSIKNSDGSIKNINNLFPELLEKLHSVDDITQRNALAQQLFGRTMADLAPILSLSAEEIANITAEAHDMGLILDKEAIDKANKFRISMEKLKARITGAGRELALGFIPIIRDDLMPLIKDTVIPLFQKVANKVKAVFEWYGNLSQQSKRTVKGFILLAVVIGPTIILVGKLIAASKVLVGLFVMLKTGTLSLAGAMTALKGSVMGVTLLVIALVALGWYWYSQWDTLSVQLKAIWAKIELAFMKGVHAIDVLINNMIINLIKAYSKIPFISSKTVESLKKVQIALLKNNAASYASIGAQQRYVNNLNSQAEANEGFVETLKKAIDSGKEVLGLKDKTIKKTKAQISAEKEQAKLTDAAEEKRKNFNKGILDQTEKFGADKFKLLELERVKAVAEAEKLKADVFAVEELYTEKKEKLLADDEKIRSEYDARTKEQIGKLTLTKLELLELERESAVQAAFDKNADTLAVAELYVLKEQELRDQIRKENSAKDKKAFKDGLNNASMIGNKLNGILSKFSDNRLKRLDMEEKRKIDSIKNSQMTEEDKETAIQKIQEVTKAKREKIERQQAIREKAAALFNIAINTAVAVVKALGTSIPLAIVVGALGAAEAVAVATKPLPFFEGGLVQGSERGVNAQIGEQNQDEIVFPLERGIDLLVNGLMEKIGNIEFPSFETPELAGTGGSATTLNLNIGTFIGDERGLKELERRLDTVRIAENQRKGF